MANTTRTEDLACTSNASFLEPPQASTDPFAEGNRFGFNSEDVPARERGEITRELASQLFAGFHLQPTNDPGFRAGMMALRAGDVVIGRGYVSSAKFDLGSAATTSSVSHENKEGVFWIYLSGGANVKQGSVDGAQEAGAAWFMNADMPGIGLTEGAHVLAINLPRKGLRRAIGHSRHLGPLALSKGDPLVHLLTGYIESTCQLPADADPALLSSVGSHVIDLVGLALGPSRDAAEQAQLGGLKSARLDAVLRGIAGNYADPEFSVVDIAAQLKLSVRYVQDILHQTGTGFSERVLELRLQEACRLLSRAHLSNRKVSDIAFSCGFNNLSYFHRAFRRRFGMTPVGAQFS